jgi:hypothetical protein
MTLAGSWECFVSAWAGPELLATYETDRRPVGLHNVLRAASPAAHDAMPTTRCRATSTEASNTTAPTGNRTASTLDRLGDGLTLLAGSDEARWGPSGHRASAPGSR